MVLGVNLLDNLVPLHLRLTKNEATEQLVGLQGLRPCKLVGGLLFFLDCGELPFLLVPVSSCLTILRSLEERFQLLPDTTDGFKCFLNVLDGPLLF